MSKKITNSEIKNMKSQLRTIITFATILEAKVDAFLDGVGAVQEKNKESEENRKETEIKFHKSLKVKNNGENTY
ncbi:hypothetical protein SAMN05660493_01489 [Epilithonimonas bovis DSM 19482]|uniref:Uncharacterized protein n=1 Tax=Epilithonimonas bovis DSM 19482 TaxID=1121284 RepID=A0A1U7PWB7_9FLAO|nr:hypothetical protein [Epilithonimonas bovis]SIT96794.1 hypothetical protein SAMN05660493_01489 [Epilithonimonas bovis DSM 19482]